MRDYKFDTPEEAYAEAERRIEAAQRGDITLLGLSDLGLASLPESIGQLTQIDLLDLAGNRLTQLPESIGQLEKLTLLDLSQNQLTHLPESIGQLEKLLTLSISGNQLTQLPESIGQLEKLRMLDVHDNELIMLPESLLSLAEADNLRELYLGGNDALGIPPEIFGPTFQKETGLEPVAPREILRYYFAQRRGSV